MKKGILGEFLHLKVCTPVSKGAQHCHILPVTLKIRTKSPNQTQVVKKTPKNQAHVPANDQIKAGKRMSLPLGKYGTFHYQK